MREVLECAHCEEKFEWIRKHPNDTAPRYCSKTCSRDAAELRRQAREEAEEIRLATGCPTPEKQDLTWISAGYTIDNVDSGMVAYRCRCGSIHVGHPNPNFLLGYRKSASARPQRP